MTTENGASGKSAPPQVELTQRQKIENLAKLSQDCLTAKEQQAEAKAETMEQKIDKLNELKKIQIHNSHQQYQECAMLREHLLRQNVAQKHEESALKEWEQRLQQEKEQKKEELLNGQKAASGDPKYDNIRSVGGLPQQGLQNLKQNQNLFLSLQSKEDKLNRWKYTLLVLDNMIDQILGRGPYRGYEQGFWGQNPNLQTTIGGSGPIRVNPQGARIDQDENELTEMQDGEIDFVKIAENLPKLAILVGPKEAPASQLALGDKKQSSGKNQNPNKTLLKASEGAGKKVQRISLQPRICSKLWEALRKSLKESFKMELEFFDHTRQELTQNFHVEALSMFQRRLQVYLANHDLLTLKQVKYGNDGRNFFEEELRAQRLVETFCNMCEKAEQSGMSTRYKMTFMQIGQSLKEELKKTDNLTEQELTDLRAACNEELGEQAHLYDNLDQILDKIYQEVSEQHRKRKIEVLGPTEAKSPEKWTNVEVAQLLVAVFNMGEGEWTEIQKRLNFQSSGVIKTPNQVAHRWHQIKRMMKRDMKKLRKSSKGSKIITKYEWILQTLRQMNQSDPAIDLKDEHLEVLQNSLLINPNSNLTPYQLIIQKFHRDQHALHEQRVQKAAKSQIKQNQKMQIQLNLKPIQITEEKKVAISTTEPTEIDKKEDKDGVRQQVGQKQGHEQRFADKTKTDQEALQSPIHPSKVLKTEDAQIIVKNQTQTKQEQLFQSPIMEIAPGIPINQDQSDQIKMKNDHFVAQPTNMNQIDQKMEDKSTDKQPLLKLQNVQNNSNVNVKNFNALSGLKETKLKDQNQVITVGKVPLTSQQQRDQSNSSMVSALNIAKTVQQSSIHQVQPGPKDIHLTQRFKENELAEQSTKLDLNIEDKTMIDKINNEIMASVNSIKLASAKHGVVQGLPGTTSVLNSNEHSSHSNGYQHPNKKPKRVQNQNVVEAQHVHSFKTSQTIGPDQNVPESQLNQQITINNNISITTIHNHEQGEKKNQKVYQTSVAPKSNANEVIPRGPRGPLVAGAATANVASTDNLRRHSMGVGGIHLQTVLDNISSGHHQTIPSTQIQQQNSGQSITTVPNTMAKKQSIGLLINNPLNTIKPPQAPTRNPSQLGAFPPITKGDSINNMLRHQSIENKQQYGMTSGQFIPNKVVGAPRLSGTQTQLQGMPGTLSKSQSTTSFQMAPGTKMQRVNSQHPVSTSQGTRVSGQTTIFGAGGKVSTDGAAKVQPVVGVHAQKPLIGQSGVVGATYQSGQALQPSTAAPKPAEPRKAAPYMNAKHFFLSKTMKKKAPSAATGAVAGSQQAQRPQNPKPAQSPAPGPAK